MSQPNTPDPELPDEEEEDATTAPNNVDALRDEMIISINLYLEALAKLDGDNEGDTPRLIPVDWWVIMKGFTDTGRAEGVVLCIVAYDVHTHKVGLCHGSTL